MEFEVDTSNLTEQQAADLAEVLAEMAADPAGDQEIVIRMPEANA